MDPSSASDIVKDIVSDLIDTILKVRKDGNGEFNLQNPFDSSELATYEAIVDASDDECELIVPTIGVQDSVDSSDSTRTEISLVEEEPSEIILDLCEDEAKETKLIEASETAKKAADAGDIVSDVGKDEPVPCVEGSSGINLQNTFDSSEVTTNEATFDVRADECELIVPTVGGQDSVDSSDSTANEIGLDEEEHSRIILDTREDEAKETKLIEASETAKKAADAGDIVSDVGKDEPIPCVEGSSEINLQKAFDSSEVTTDEATLDASEGECELIAPTIDVVNASDSSASETILDEEEPSKIILDAGRDDSKEIKLNEACEPVQKDGDAGEMIVDVGKDEPLNEASEIILQILETAYNAVNASEATSEITMLASEDQASHALEIDKTNEIETQSLSDADIKSSDLESDTSLIVESIDCFHDNEIDRDVGIVAAIERSEPNAVMSPPPVVIAQTCETEDQNDKQRVNENPDIGLDGQKTIVAADGIGTTAGAGATNNLSKLPANGEFYSDEELRRKGYGIVLKSTIKRLVNLVLSADKSHKSTAYCSGFPHDASANQLVPLFEKFGRVFELIVVLDAGVINVTYMTDKECETAINALNGRKIHGRAIKVEKYCKKTRLHVHPISVNARKQELIDQFNKLTKGLVSVFLPYSIEHESQNRGFCYVEYNSFESAKEAKKILSNMNYNGRKVLCDWARVQPDQWKGRDKAIVGAIDPKWRKVFMNNLRPGLTAANLRTLFSVYGEVTEIDKSENWASVKFLHADAAKRAVLNIDKKLLGNESVQISLEHLKNTSEVPANSGDYKRKPLETTPTTCSTEPRSSIPTVNKKSFGAARNERHGSQENQSPKRGPNERYGNPQSPKLGSGDRRNIRNGSDNRQARRRNDNKSSKHGSSGNSVTTSTLGPATARANSTCDDNSTPNNDRCGSIDANATTMNKPGKSFSKIFFL